MLVLGEAGRYLGSFRYQRASDLWRLSKLRCLVGELDDLERRERALRLDERRIRLDWRNFILSLSRLNKLNLLLIEI